MRVIVFSILLALLASQSAHGQSVSDDDKKVSIKDLVGRIDLDVPDSPAFAILGISPQNVINPDTPAELAAALFVGDDGDGNSQEGLAIEFRPYLVAMKDSLVYDDYTSRPWLSRTAVSFSESKGVDPSDRTKRRAIGLSFTPIDDRDPLESTDLTDCIKTGPKKEIEDKENQLSQRVVNLVADPSSSGTEKEAARKELEDFYNGDYKKAKEKGVVACKKDHLEKTANATQLQLGIAYHDSEVSEFDENGNAFWTSYSRPIFGNSGSLILHARYSENVLVPDTENEGQYFIRDETLVGVRLRRGDERRAVLFEASYVDEKASAGDVDDEYTTALIGVEFKVAESLWIQLAFGDTFGSNQDKAPALSGQFRWAASKSRLLKRD